MTKAETGGARLQARHTTDGRPPPETGAALPSQCPAGPDPASQHLDVEPLASGTVRKPTAAVSSHRVCGDLSQRLRETNTVLLFALNMVVRSEEEIGKGEGARDIFMTWAL